MTLLEGVLVIGGGIGMTALILVPLFALLDGGWPWWELSTVNKFIEDYNKYKDEPSYPRLVDGKVVEPFMATSCHTGGLGYDTHCSIRWGEYQWRSYLDPSTGNAYYKWEGTIPPDVKHPNYYVKQIHRFLRDNRKK